MIYVTMFNLTYLTLCSFIYYSYGNLDNLSSQILSALSLATTIATFIGVIILPEYAGRFRFSFRHHQLAFHHYFFHIACIVSTILLISFFPDYSWVAFIPQVLMLVYTIIFRPYKKLSENVRSAFNYTIMCVITSMRVYFSFINENEFQTW